MKSISDCGPRVLVERDHSHLLADSIRVGGKVTIESTLILFLFFLQRALIAYAFDKISRALITACKDTLFDSPVQEGIRAGNPQPNKVVAV